MVFPFPYGLGAALAIFIAFPLIEKTYMNRMRSGYLAVTLVLAAEDSLEWVLLVALVVYVTYVLYVTTNTKVVLVHDVALKCNVLTSKNVS